MSFLTGPRLHTRTSGLPSDGTRNGIFAPMRERASTNTLTGTRQRAASKGLVGHHSYRVPANADLGRTTRPACQQESDPGRCTYPGIAPGNCTGVRARGD